MNFKYTDDINIVPIQHRKKCEWSNYIPHKTPNYSNKVIWIEYYKTEIIDMYKILQRIIEQNYPGQINWDRQSIFTNFITVLYHCSSKHIETI
jgi:hypothetical protein